MKIFYSVFILTTVLLACNNAEQKNDDTKETVTQTEPKTAETNSVINTLDIKIPESTDPELNEFFKAYTSHLNEYVNAVRDNNQAQIKTSFQREKKFRIQLLDMPARLHKTLPAEWEKYKNYRSKTNKYMDEIEKSDYVKQLHEEALKKF
jgi:hypothetical protein